MANEEITCGQNTESPEENDEVDSDWDVAFDAISGIRRVLQGEDRTPKKSEVTPEQIEKERESAARLAVD